MYPSFQLSVCALLLDVAATSDVSIICGVALLCGIALYSDSLYVVYADQGLAGISLSSSLPRKMVLKMKQKRKNGN